MLGLNDFLLLGAGITAALADSSASVGDNRLGLAALVCRCTGSFKENVHLLKREALGLGDEVPGKDKADDERGTEKEEGTVFDVGHHVWGRIDDHELAEPLSAGGEHKADGADGNWEHLGTRFC
jgi:hypothetical protein